MLEQRKFVRYPTEGKAILKAKQDLSRSISGDLVDISILGIGVYALEKFEPGLEVNFIVMGKFSEKPILGGGRIKYALALKKEEKTFYRMGVEFITVDKEIIQKIIICIQEGKL